MHVSIGEVLISVFMSALICGMFLEMKKAKDDTIE
jgi:hypothetical protein